MHISTFFSGEVSSFWPHAVLLTTSVLASGAVAWGIIREAENLWSLTTLLVVGGVALEAICTLFLFGFDEGISKAQQSKIIALERQLAPRSITAEGQKRVATAVKDFAGQKFEGMVGGAVPDAWGLWIEIRDTLIRAKWVDSQPPNTKATGGVSIPVLVLSGVDIFVPVFDPDFTSLMQRAQVLATALRAEGIDAAAMPTPDRHRPAIITIDIGMKMPTE
jgi:hypothetical protein